MAFDRAPRNPILNLQTTPKVSPNTYWIKSPPRCGCIGNYKAPFLVSSSRMKKSSTNNNPGPANYFPVQNAKILGGSSISNKSPRFAKSLELIPGPASYDPFHVSEDQDEIDNIKPDKPEPVGFIYHCSVPYTLLGFSPTIPGKNDCGYDIGPDNILLKYSCGDHDTTIGPAFYEVPRPTYEKGCKWSWYKSKRKYFRVLDTPGPGTYDISPSHDPVKEHIELFRAEKRKKCNVPRYIDKVQLKVLRENYPAPNQYTIKKPKLIKEGKKVQMFNVTSKRFNYGLKEGPSPNSYNDPRTAFNYLIKPYSTFGFSSLASTGPRFLPSKRSLTPGPQYSIKGFSEEAAGKISPYAVRNNAFNSSAPRNTFPVTREAMNRPAPNAYDRSFPPGAKYPQTSSFSSKTKRIGYFTPSYDASPASYDVTPSHNFARGRKNHRKASKGNFSSTAKRFCKVSDFPAKYPDLAAPGPKYNLANFKPGRECKVGKLPVEARFRCRHEDTPSPMEYKLHPVVESSVMKRTFNITLGNPIPSSSPMVEFSRKRHSARILKLCVEKFAVIMDEEETALEEKDRKLKPFLKKLLFGSKRVCKSGEMWNSQDNPVSKKDENALVIKSNPLVKSVGLEQS